MKLHVEHGDHKRYVIINVEGDLSFNTVSEFKSLAMQYLENRVPVIGFNLKLVDFIDSTGVGSCLKLLSVGIQKQKKLYIIDASEEVVTILKASGLLNKFKLVSWKEFLKDMTTVP